MAEETEISAALWALWLGKDLRIIGRPVFVNLVNSNYRDSYMTLKNYCRYANCNDIKLLSRSVLRMSIKQICWLCRSNSTL